MNYAIETTFACIGAVASALVTAVVVLTTVASVAGQMEEASERVECEQEHNVYKCERIYVPVEAE